MKKVITLLVLCVTLLSLVACQTDTPTNSTTLPGASTPPVSGEKNAIPYQSDLVSGKFSEFDLETACGLFTGDLVYSDAGITFTGNGATISGTVATITKPGCYRVSGNSTDGQLVISVTSLEKVHLVFSGLTLTCQNSAPLMVANADKVCVTLAKDTVNTLSDGASFGTGADAPNACIYAKDSITFNGEGSLVVNANLHNGIDCSNDLKFVSGHYQVKAANNAIKGNDSVAILHATMTIEAGKDAIKSDTINDPTKGFVYIASGTFTITATDDGIQATTAIELQGGRFTMACDGKTINSKDGLHISEQVVIENVN